MPKAASARSRFLRNGSVNSVMTPLNKMIWIVELILGACTTGGVIFQAPSWMLICFMSFMGFIIFLYAAVYVFFMIKEPSRLQTEEYNLEQQEMGYMYSSKEVANDDPSLTIPKKKPIEINRIEG